MVTVRRTGRAKLLLSPIFGPSAPCSFRVSSVAKAPRLRLCFPHSVFQNSPKRRVRARGLPEISRRRCRPGPLTGRTLKTRPNSSFPWHRTR